MADDNEQVEYVTLVAKEIITPYKKGEVFTVTKPQADMLLTRNMAENDFGPINPVVKVRLYDPEKDEQLLLDNHVLNAIEHKKLQNKLHPKKTNTEDKNTNQ